jgi:hypothetical protein
LQSNRASQTIGKDGEENSKLRIKNLVAQAAHWLETNNTHEAYHYLQGWYKLSKVKATIPTGKEMFELQKEYKALYSAVLPTYTMYDIDNKMPEEMESVQSLKRMRLNKAPGLSGITINMIQKWFYDAKKS